jgi:hypothetical protein
MVAGVEVVQTLSSFLPRQAVVSTRPDIAGMDSTICKEFAKWFVEQVRDLTAGGRKVLPRYDGYRSHINIEALDTFASSLIHSRRIHRAPSSHLTWLCSGRSSRTSTIP